MNHPKKIALVADWITHWGGAERVFVKLMEMYPEADIYTSVFFPDRPEAFSGRKIHTSFIQHIPILNKRHKLCMLLRPLAFSRFDFSDYDLVISSSSAEAKGIRVKHKSSKIYNLQFTIYKSGIKSHPQLKFEVGSLKFETKHVCYCHTPTRYLWSHSDQYRKFLEFGWLNWLAKLVIPMAFRIMKKWDYEAAQRPDVFIANSYTTASRIKCFYDRESTVVYPFFSSNEKGIINNEEGRIVNNGDHAPLIKGGRGDFSNLDSTGLELSSAQFSPPMSDLVGMTGYFVCLGRIVPYKKFDIAIEACNQLGLNLKIFTNTRNTESERLQKLSGPTIEWIFGASDTEVAAGLAGAEAFIMPQEEDFGIVALEAMVHGTPVIAYGEGGATETVIHGQTGLIFSQQNALSLATALERSKTIEWDKNRIREQGLSFSEKRFEEGIRAVIAKLENPAVEDIVVE